MPSFTDAQVEQVREILDGRLGAENAITSGDIKDRLEIDENETTPTTRAIITHLIKEDNMPIGAKTGGPNAGYFIIETQDELYNYLGTLSSRSSSLEDRHRAVMDAADASDHLTVTGEDSEDPL
jgi:hypothetical protein